LVGAVIHVRWIIVNEKKNVGTEISKTTSSPQKVKNGACSHILAKIQATLVSPKTLFLTAITC
jgi:hypothetical protein